MARTRNPKNLPIAVHFGAGNIGRGFVACFLHESGYYVVFADVVKPVVDALNTTEQYKVIEVGAEGTDSKTITDYEAINTSTPDGEADVIDLISQADVVTCSVGPNVLRFIAPVIAKGVDKRSDKAPLAVIACENAIGATDKLAVFIKDPKHTPAHRLDDHHERAAYANSAIDRIVPAQDPNAGLDVTLEKFYEWVVEKTPFADSKIPSIQGIKWVDNLQPYIERKLFTVNTGHATAAYHGYNRKKPTVDDALLDKDVKAEVAAALAETGKLIVEKHGISAEEQEAYKQKIITRISNPHLADAVERVGRQPIRKLGREERFIAPALELAKMGYSYDALLRAAEMAFRFQNVEGDDQSKELAEIMKKSPEEVVKEVCQWKDTDDKGLFNKLVQVVEAVKRDSQD